LSLILHAGAEAVDYDSLREIDTPPATQSHVPIPHFRVVDLIKTTLGMFGHQVTDEHYGVTKDGLRFFGVLSLRSSYTGYEDMVAFRNSNDKAWPCTVGIGSRVFCCDNMALIADHKIVRRHTANLKRDLPGLISEIIEPLAVVRETQARKLQHYKRAMLTDQQADHVIMRLYREGVINIQRVPDVVNEWEKPSFPDLEERSAWRLLNATTYALRGRVMERTEATPKLHQILDGVCEEVA
jgi:hypothetical protein